MKVILSIKPEYVNKILWGNKKYEFRRRIWKRDIKEALVYSGKPVQRITMAFKIDNIIEGPPQLLWDQYHEFAGISHDDFFKYFITKDKMEYLANSHIDWNEWNTRGILTYIGRNYYSNQFWEN